MNANIARRISDVSLPSLDEVMEIIFNEIRRQAEQAEYYLDIDVRPRFHAGVRRRLQDEGYRVEFDASITIRIIWGDVPPGQDKDWWLEVSK